MITAQKQQDRNITFAITVAIRATVKMMFLCNNAIKHGLSILLKETISKSLYFLATDY
jgi:hypothetical protein